MFGLFKRKKQEITPRVDTDEALAGASIYNQPIYADFDGDKFLGGFGPTNLFSIDYWTLRERSAQLFTENLYARGLIRRLITNEINTGLSLECEPEENVIGVEETSLDDWSEDVEVRFNLWANDPNSCDIKGLSTLGKIMAIARMEALVEGDVLVILKQSKRTNLPTIQLIRGGAVRTPFDNYLDRDIQHGVELDENGRHVAFHIDQKDGGSKRIPAYGSKSGRRIAWLIYGTDKRMDETRGQPILALVLQSLKEIDRYRDAQMRKAIINATLAMFIKKTQDKIGTLPMSGAATRIDQVANVADPAGTPDRSFSVTNHGLPGIVMQELQQGEEPVGFNGNGSDEHFGGFEAAIISGVAWANEIPPNILRLGFSHNYSASQGEINEFKAYLDRVRKNFGDEFCQPIFKEWIISEVLNGNVKAPGLLKAWRDKNSIQVNAWLSTEWAGAIKPSTDIFKQARGYELLISLGAITRNRASRELTGTKYSRNAKILQRENEKLVEVRRPLAEFTEELNNTGEDDGQE